MKRPINKPAVRQQLTDTTNLIVHQRNDRNKDNRDQPPAKKKSRTLPNLRNGARMQEKTKPLKNCAQLMSTVMHNHGKSTKLEPTSLSSEKQRISPRLRPAKRKPQGGESFRTPYERWKEEFQSYLKRHGFIGSLLIQGLQISQSHQLQDNDHDRTRSNLTQQDLERIRYILITESRAEKLDFIRTMVIDEYNHPWSQHIETGLPRVIVYDQHGTFGRHVHQVWKNWNSRIMFNVKLQSERLDWLVAFTHTINECDAWMYDDPEADDEEITAMVQSLAAAWQRLFNKEKNEKANLAWDEQYTKPGVLELLQQFRAKVEACPALGPFHVVPPEVDHP